MIAYTLSLLALAAPIFASPQYGYGPPPDSGGSSSSTSAASPAPSAPADSAGQMNIDVFPNGQFVFSRPNITATNGTNVSFYFPSGITHSVAQSTFASPCTRINNGSNVGFDSGLMQNGIFTITITDDQQPIWYHCQQVTHCGQGMVGSINAPTTGNNTYQAFLAQAKSFASNDPAESDTTFSAGSGLGASAAQPGTAASGGGSTGSSGVIPRTVQVPLLIAGVLAGAMLI